MTLPTTPEGWAIRLSQLLNVVAAHGGDRFPISIATIARDYSRTVFPEAPITRVDGMNLSKRFEGALIPNENGEWGIFYNENIRSTGRRNFTLAHELGHYLLHRQRGAIQCEPRQMLDWKSEYGQIESQANIFASFLLMPLDDFREQIRSQKPSMEMMRHLKDRYQVSLSAAILKWLNITEKRAMIVIGKDGFIDWAWCSEPLLKSGVFYRARQDVIDLPGASLAARRDATLDNVTGVMHPKGVWPNNEEVQEMMVLSRDGEITTSLLIYPDDAPNRFLVDDEEPELMDTYTKFSINSR